jgi:hypothetical protein
MSEFMEDFSRRLRRAAKVLGERKATGGVYRRVLFLDGYVLDLGFNKDGEEIITLWISEHGRSRSWIIYSEFDGKPDFQHENWEFIVEVSDQLKRRMLLDELADV